VLYRLHFGAQLSRGGVGEARRAQDWLAYAGMVGAGLAAHPGAASRGDLAHWRRVEREAARQYRAAGGDPGAGDSLPLALADRAHARLKRWRSGVSRRVAGTSFGLPFGSAPLTPDQADLIRAIGYEPVRDRAAGG